MQRERRDAARRARQAAQAHALAPEIDTARLWVLAQTRESPLPAALARPLVAGGWTLLG